MSERPRSIGFRRAALHLGGLWALAFAQPLFDLLGRNAQFFVARGSTTGDILVLAFAYTLVPPLAGAGVVWALGRIRPVAGWVVHLVLVAALVAALALPPLGDVLGGSAAAIASAAVVGAGAAALYARAEPARSFLTVLSPAPLVVIALFLVVSPVRELIVPAGDGGSLAGPTRSSTPIVHIVLDELAVTTIDAGDGTIDAELFPNLAKLARDATWYRNATTVDDLTAEAVPAQLTGVRPDGGSLPTARFHPRSLFTLFGRSHDLIVVEPITDVCPDRLCEDRRPATLDRLGALRSDLTIVAEHLLLPDDLRDSLPPVDGAWEDFDPGTPTGELTAGANLMEDVIARLRRDDATAGFEHAMSELDRPRSRPPLVFMHSSLPHGPWRFLPDGRQYVPRPKAYPGLKEEGWGPRQWLGDQGFQRHVLQTQYTDRLVGALLRKLRSKGLYDRAIIVLAADHGVSVRAGEPRRPATPGNVQDIAPVPLLVKLPGQRQGRIDESAVRTVDVLPTIAKAAGVRMPWRIDGVPVDQRPVDPAAEIDVSHAGVHVLTVPLETLVRGRREREAEQARLLRRGVWSMGTRPELVGRRVGVSTVAPGGPRVTFDAPGLYAAVDLDAAVLPTFVSGRVEGMRADADIAIAVNGRIAATTRVYPFEGRMLYGALVPPPSLRPGSNAITVLEVLPGSRLRAIGAVRDGQAVTMER